MTDDDSICRGTAAQDRRAPARGPRALRGRRRVLRRWALLPVSLAVVFAIALSPACWRRDQPAVAATATDVDVVQGPSWLRHLGLKPEETRLGQAGGQTPARGAETPAATARAESAAVQKLFSLGRQSDDRAGRAILAKPITASGSDLYRLDCQSCHGSEGNGAPPEILPLVDPVRATSVALVRERMEKAGHPIPEEMAKTLADQAEASLRHRIREGGKEMPGFPHLHDAEVNALLGYLGQLAGVPQAKPAPAMVTVSLGHLAEHLVAGTCHVCHDATGPGASPMMMMRSGVIPSLASLPQQRSATDVVAKVREGRSSMGGMGHMMGGGMGMGTGAARMPTFPYVTSDEVALAYAYLALYPPRP